VDQSPAAPSSKPILRPMLAAGAAMAVLSLTGAPTPKTLGRLEALGVPADQGALLLHAAPVLIAVTGLGAGLLLARGRGSLTRGLILAGAGGIIGFLTAFCLDLFVGALPLMERATGPLREATSLDVAAWCLAVLSMAYGLMTLAIAQFGTPAMRAINFEGVDDECLDVRPRDRGEFGLASAGILGQGVFIGAIAVLHQMDPAASGAMRGGAVVVLALGVLVSVWCSWKIWKRMDELMRRTVMDAYAWSGIVATVGGVIWAVLEGLKIAPPLSAYALIILLIFVQTMMAIFITAGFGSPAKVRREVRS
jgi:hypothetical protein